MIARRRKSAALSTLTELAALTDLGMEGLRAMTLAVQDLLPVNAAVVDLRNADAEAVGCIGDGERFNDQQIGRFFSDYYDTPAEDVLGTSCRALFQETIPFSYTSETSHGWRESQLFLEFFAPLGVTELIRLPLWRGGLPAGLLVLGRASGARALTEGELTTLLDIRALCERIADRVTTPVLNTGALAGEVTWVTRPRGEIELASPSAEQMAAMAFGLQGVLPSARRDIARWLRTVFLALREKLDRGELAVLDRRNSYGLFQFRAGWLQGGLGSARHKRLSVRLSRHVQVTTRLFLSQRFRGLPRREKQTVLALSEGASTQQLARRQQVAPSTALSWIRSLYQRFGVNRRGDLIALLLADAHAPLKQ